MNTNQGAERKAFILGLSLAGGISAGAYIAGAVDFIVEAMDAFQKAKESGDPMAPPHDVVVKTVCGASAGALTAATLGAALRYDFPPVHPDTGDDRAARNPLFDSWVNMTTAANLLGTEDRDDDLLKSLLDTTPLENVAKKAIAFGAGHARFDRTWVANPLHIAFTVTNLRGVPFALGDPRTHGSRMRMHADVLRFGICGLGSQPQGRIHADEIALSFPVDAPDKWPRWGPTFASAALASAAFPALLAGRQVQRPRSDYDHIETLLPASDDRPAASQALIPAWDAQQSIDGNTYAFDAADGGLLDNDPIDIARAILNDRDVTKATARNGSTSLQAVLTIDPMTEDGSGPKAEFKTAGLFSNLVALIPALRNQARFRPVEIALAEDETTYSRFLIAPLRDQPYGYESGRHVTGASCGGFGGYLSRAFRKHDYLLGRQNAQRFLAEKLVLPKDNPLFDEWRNSPEIVKLEQRYEVPGTHQWPIIPLIGALHPAESRERIPAWPLNQADLDALGGYIDARADLVWEKAVRQWNPRSAGFRVLKYIAPLFWKWKGRSKVRTAAIDWLRKGLQHHGLA